MMQPVFALTREKERAVFNKNITHLASHLVFAVFLILLILPAFLKIPIFVFYVFILSCVLFSISLINTDFALILLIFSMLFSPELKAGGIPGRAVVIRSDDIFIIIIFLGWMAKMALRKELGVLRTTSLNRPILTYILVCTVATLLGIIQGNLTIKQSFFYLLKYLEYFLLFFMVSNNLKDIKQAKRFIFYILLTCFFVCIYAWWQLPSVERLSAPFETEGGEPNTFAGYLLLMMGVISGLILYPSSKRQRLILLGLLVFALIPFIFTYSRGGWLGFFPMLFTFVVLNRKFRFPLFMIVLVLLVITPFIMPAKVHERAAETFQEYKSYRLLGNEITLSESAAARMDSWKIGFLRWLKRPVLGFGIPSGGVIDNQYTRVLTETGIIGMLVFIWLIRSIFRMGLRNYRASEKDNFIRGLNLGLMAGMTGILVQAFSAAVFIIIRVMEPFWFMAAVAATLPQLSEEKKT